MYSRRHIQVVLWCALCLLAACVPQEHGTKPGDVQSGEEGAVSLNQLLTDAPSVDQYDHDADEDEQTESPELPGDFPVVDDNTGNETTGTDQDGIGDEPDSDNSADNESDESDSDDEDEQSDDDENKNEEDDHQEDLDDELEDAGNDDNAGNSEDSPPRAQAIGDGPFTLDVQQTMEALGVSRVSGVVDHTHIFEAYDALELSDGLLRHTLKMHENYTIESVWMAYQSGMRSWLTCVGTPEDNASSFDGDLGNGLEPPYARSTPVDIQLWADDLVERLQTMEASGHLPHYIEIWNEPEHDYYWSGTREEFLEFFEVVAITVKRAFPEIQVGGPGLAGVASNLGGDESLLLQIARRAAERGFPLDFLSWHEYEPAGQVRYRQVIQQLKALLDELDMSDVALICSEHNNYPNYNDPDSQLMNEHPGAAKMAGLVANISSQMLDGNIFLDVLDRDVFDSGLSDFQYPQQGALTIHGVYKPVARMMQLMRDYAVQSRVAIEYPSNEWSSSLFATRSGNCVSAVVTYEPVGPEWVWIWGAYESGFGPQTLSSGLQAVMDRQLEVTVDALVRVGGLSESEAQYLVDDLIPRTDQAEALRQAGRRTVDIYIPEAIGLSLGQALRFNSTQNNPVTRYDEFESMLAEAESQAQLTATAAMEAYLRSIGVFDIPDLTDVSNASELAALLGITLEQAEQAIDTYEHELIRARLAMSDELNAHPATDIAWESAQQARVTYDEPSQVLSVEIEDHSVTIVEFCIEQ